MSENTAPLHDGCMAGEVKVTKVLLENGAYVESTWLLGSEGNSAQTFGQTQKGIRRMHFEWNNIIRTKLKTDRNS